MAINERLSRDLHEAESFNVELGRLDAALDAFEKELGSERPGERLASHVRGKLNWRKLSFLEIRPGEDLDGNLAVGFLSKRLRRRYLRLGREAAERQLGAWTPGSIAQPQAPENA